jgi:hypothetical protein
VMTARPDPPPDSQTAGSRPTEPTGRSRLPTAPRSSNRSYPISEPGGGQQKTGPISLAPPCRHRTHRSFVHHLSTVNLAQRGRGRCSASVKETVLHVQKKLTIHTRDYDRRNKI